MQLRGDDITPGHAALRDFDPSYRRFGVISAGAGLGGKSLHVRCTPNSDRKLQAMLFVVKCQFQT
jgi:hypothetical protein